MKRCSRCGKKKPFADFNAKTRDHHGRILTYQSACRRCVTERQRELRGWQPRKPKVVRTPEEEAERARAARRAYVARIKADPKLLAEWRVERRMQARLSRDRKRGRPPRVYPQRTVLAAKPGPWRNEEDVARPWVVQEAFAPAAPRNHSGQQLDAGPFADWLRREFVGWTPSEIAARTTLDPEHVRRLLSGEYRRTSLATVDRAFVAADCTHLLALLYPLEEVAA